jgi:hypothetical protein
MHLPVVHKIKMCEFAANKNWVLKKAEKKAKIT